MPRPAPKLDAANPALAMAICCLTLANCSGLIRLTDSTRSPFAATAEGAITALAPNSLRTASITTAAAFLPLLSTAKAKACWLSDLSNVIDRQGRPLRLGPNFTVGTLSRDTYSRMVSGKAATAASHFSSMDRLSDAAGEATGWAGAAGDAAGAPHPALAAVVATAGCTDGEPAGRSLTGPLTGPLPPTDSWEAVL